MSAQKSPSGELTGRLTATSSREEAAHPSCLVGEFGTSSPQAEDPHASGSNPQLPGKDSVVHEAVPLPTATTHLLQNLGMPPLPDAAATSVDAETGVREEQEQTVSQLQPLPKKHLYGRAAYETLSVTRKKPSEPARSKAALPASSAPAASSGEGSASCTSKGVGSRQSGAQQKPLEVGGYLVEGVSVGGQETCVIIPSLKIAFDSGRCPPRSVFQERLLISHAHMDHIGGLVLHIASRHLFALKPPTVVVPRVNAALIEKLVDIYRELDGSPLPHSLVGMEVGEELTLDHGHFIKAFRTYHVVPSQGYLVYSRKQKLKAQFVGLRGDEIRNLKQSGVEIADTVDVPEVAFTGDTTAEFITDPDNADVLKAKLLIMEATFLDSAMTVEHARAWGHTHLSEVAELADRFENKAILLIHFSARYKRQDIEAAIAKLPAGLRERCTPLLERFY